MAVHVVHGRRMQEAFTKLIDQHRKKVFSLTPQVKAATVLYKNYSILCDNVQIPISVFYPNTVNEYLPTILYIPGTAFVANAPAYTHLVCSHIAQKSRCQVIAIDLPLAPEYQFPYNIHAGYSALKYLLNLPTAWSKINLDKVALLGYSSGGNYATSMGILAKADRLPITKLVLISPWLDLSCSVKGFEEKFENKDSTLPDSFLNWVLELYIPKSTRFIDPLLSPFWETASALQSLPQTDIFVGEFDRFRGDTEVFYRKLVKAEVSTNKFIIQGGNHSFWWQQIEIVQAIALRLGILLNSTPPHHTTKSANHHVAMLCEQS